MSRKNKKPQKLRARLPRGFVDRSPSDIRATDAMVEKIRSVYELYGFDPVETPMFEYTDCLGKFLPDTDRPNAGVFSVSDDDDQWMSLRYDLTAPLARHVAENYNDIQLPYRTYRSGWVFRNEKPGPGRFRQFMQFDADSVGAPGVHADAEMCMMMADVLEEIGIETGDYFIRVNSRKILDAIMERAGLSGDECAAQRLIVVRAIDKWDKFGAEGVRLLLGDGRWDGGKLNEGDFTKGAGLDEVQITNILNFVSPENNKVSTTVVNDALPKDVHEIPSEELSDEIQRELNEQGHTTYLDNLKILDHWDRYFRGSPAETSGLAAVDELRTMFKIFEAAEYRSKRIRPDPSCVRGLEYYTGPVYEAELTFDVVNEKGKKVVFGSVGGGGRYDGLVSRFMGQPVPATGFSIGVSRLMTALKNLGKLEDSDVIAPVVICVMDRDTESLARYQGMVQSLRNEGIRAEMYQGNPKKFGNQLKYADHRGSPIAIIQGSDERDNGEIQIKDLIEGKRLSEEIEDNVTWRETRPAQITAKEVDLISEVQKILEAQAADRIAAKSAG